MPFKNISKKIEHLLDEPHEKIYINILNIILFSFIYYHYYKKDKSSFIVNETLLKNRENGELTYYDMLYYSLLLNFKISFGDVVPLTDEIKVITSLQTFIFWYIALY